MTQPHGVISRPEKVLPFSRPKRVAVVTNNFNQCVKRGKEVRFRDLHRRAAGPDVHVDACTMYSRDALAMGLGSVFTQASR